MKDVFYQKLIEIIDATKVKTNEPLKKRTSLRIGGNADYFVLPSKTEEIKKLILLCKNEKMPYFIMGNGSNILVSDLGYRGLIIYLNEQYGKVDIKEDGLVIAQSGILLSKLSKSIAAKDYTGFEFAEGIPGTLGGAVTMNAGAYGGEIKDCIVYAKVIDIDGNIIKIKKDDLLLGYRRSVLQDKKYILLEAGLQFNKGNPDEINKRMLELRKARRDKQPIEKFSAGSAFKRPLGYYAGKLISDSGLRGYQIGDIEVSSKHCGFVINNGNGNAKDFLAMLKHIIKTVEDKYGVTLEPEIRLLGDI